MLRSISIRNFINFRDKQRLEFKDGANYIVGANSSGKSAIFELVRRCLSNEINTTMSSFNVDKQKRKAGPDAYAVCHYEIPNDNDRGEIPNDNSRGYLACLFIEEKPHSENDKEEIVDETRNSIEDKRSYFYYKLVVKTELPHISGFIFRMEGSYACDIDELHPPVYDYFSYTKHPDISDMSDSNLQIVLDAIEDLTKTTCIDYQASIHSLFNTLKCRSIYNLSLAINFRKTVHEHYQLLEKAYVGVMPMRSIGPLQWTRSKLNCHSKRGENYQTACNRAEILQALLDSDSIDWDEEKKFHKALVGPYRFEKERCSTELTGTIDNEVRPIIYVYNDASTGHRRPLLKTPEGILEAKQLTLLLAHKEIYTITLEEPEMGMHPPLIEKMRNIFKKIKKKTVLIISHHPSMLDHSALGNTYFCSTVNEQGVHKQKVLKFPQKYRRYGQSEELKNILFSQRVMFVEGITDKIIIEGIFDVFVNEPHIDSENPEMKERLIDNEFKEYLSSFRITNLEGKENAKSRSEFCKEVGKEYCVVLDFNAVEKKAEKGYELRVYFEGENGKTYDRQFKDKSDFLNDKDAIQVLDEESKKSKTFVWIKGDIEDVIDSVAEYIKYDAKERLKISILRSNRRKWKNMLLLTEDKDIAHLAETLIEKSAEMGRFVNFLFEMMNESSCL